MTSGYGVQISYPEVANISLRSLSVTLKPPGEPQLGQGVEATCPAKVFGALLPPVHQNHPGLRLPPPPFFSPFAICCSPLSPLR